MNAISKQLSVKEIAGRFVVGTEVYYTGDMANREGHGRIVSVRPPDRWNSLPTANILMDDGREMLGIWAQNFDGPGRRFEFADDRKAAQARRMAELQREYEARMAVN